MSKSYDADELLDRMRADTESDWALRLLRDIARAPLVPEQNIGGVLNMSDGAREDLSEAELRALQGAAVGLTAGKISDLYGIPRHTIKAQLARAKVILRAKNGTHAVALAFRQGLIQ